MNWPSGPSIRSSVPRLQSAEHLLAELAARRAPDVQLEQRRIVRRIREREAAAALAGQHDVDVLARTAR